MEIKANVRYFINFLLPRYPFFNALTILLLLAERASRETAPPFNATYIYGCVGVLFVCGLGMGFERLSRPLSLVLAVQLIAMAVVVFTSESLNYRYWVKLRMSHRMLGVSGYFMLFAYFKSTPKNRQESLRRFAEILIGLYVLLAAYILLQSAEDREAFLRFVPGYRPVLFIYATLLATVGVCYLPGQFVYDLTQALVLLVTISTVAVDMRFSYWTKQRGIDYWNQVRMVGDNVTIIVGAILLLASTKKKIVPEEKVD